MRQIAEDQYNSMSYFYDVLYSGIDLMDFENTFINQYQDLLNTLPKNAKVLDSSCGNGVQATALKRKGFNVVASDISEEMIRLTRGYADRNKLSFPTESLSWTELPSKYSDEFDAVFCIGNSISHSMGKDEMLSNLRALYKVTKNNGRLVIDTRNWDKLQNRYQRFQTSDVKSYNDKKYIFTYIWNAFEFNKSSYVEILFIEIINDKETKSNPIRLDFVPFSHEDFIDRLRSCGFRIQYDSFQPEIDYYHIVLEK